MAELRKKITTRYVDKEGKRCESTDPGARKVITRSKKWYAVGSPLPRGKWVPLSPDKSVAQIKLADLVSDLERGSVGLPSLAEAKRPLMELVKQWHQILLAQPGADVEWARLVTTRLGKLFNGKSFSRVSDINTDAVTQWLADQRALPRGKGQLSQQTCNHYRAHLHAFCNWLQTKNVLQNNPADGVPIGDVQGDLRNARRELSPAELQHLFDAAKASSKLGARLNGRERYILYLLACATGFRRSELWALRPDWFDLEGSPPTVLLPGRCSKNGERARQPLPTAIVADLREYLRGRDPAQPLWRETARKWTARILDRDLEEAGIPGTIETPEGPKHVHFHSLRHTFISWLIENGATVKETQILSRHKTPSITIERYAHVGQDSLALRVNSLPLTKKAGEKNLEDLSREELLAICQWSIPAVAALVAALGVPTCLFESQPVPKREQPEELSPG